MKILGIDFTSRPSRRKPITCIYCTLDDHALRMQSFQEWHSYEIFEAALAMPGPWIAGIDFPFGQSRRFVETIGWPQSWAAYVHHAGQLGRNGFREALNGYKENRVAGDKEHRRATDEAAGSISPQKLYGVPVGLMFFEGAPRLLASRVTIPHLQEGDPERIAIEAYPGVLARQFIGRRSYKNDTRKKQTADQHEARGALLQALREEAPRRYGFGIYAQDGLCDDPGADHLDALLCAVQAAWAWRQRIERFGAPETVDRLEGWIADPHLAPTVPRRVHGPFQQEADRKHKGSTTERVFADG
ncbi:hypothetical protein GCM10011402_32060 [Paracoccus acridae]|uniref:DUF429 domain-containing protein n=1 Tax=Paracoccus acridae TaxID=1795310 RepID=A0ABQ1VLL1_9RHOB|nr:DUF429 domain-containing protein [Paracoccus acridae]GGF76939.1 hypothetical protein GCM10011402_32060 [Paracoccus acridae]